MTDLFGNHAAATAPDLHQYNLSVNQKEQPRMTAEPVIYQTKTTKGYDGWNAETRISLGKFPAGERVLKLNTRKSRTGVATCASVMMDDGISETMVIFQDYMKWHNQTPASRVTESVVRAAHSETLGMVPEILAEVRVHYEKESGA